MSPFSRFLRLEDLIRDQGDVTLVVEYENKFPNYSTIIAFSEISSSPSPTDISLCYFEACNTNQCTVVDSQSPLIFETKYLDGDNNPEVYLRLEYISLDANDKICTS